MKLDICTLVLSSFECYLASIIEGNELLMLHCWIFIIFIIYLFIKY